MSKTFDNDDETCMTIRRNRLLDEGVGWCVFIEPYNDLSENAFLYVYGERFKRGSSDLTCREIRFLDDADDTALIDDTTSASLDYLRGLELASLDDANRVHARVMAHDAPYDDVSSPTIRAADATRIASEANQTSLKSDNQKSLSNIR